MEIELTYFRLARNIIKDNLGQSNRLRRFFKPFLALKIFYNSDSTLINDIIVDLFTDKIIDPLAIYLYETLTSWNDIKKDTNISNIIQSNFSSCSYKLVDKYISHVIYSLSMFYEQEKDFYRRLNLKFNRFQPKRVRDSLIKYLMVEQLDKNYKVDIDNEADKHILVRTFMQEYLAATLIQRTWMYVRSNPKYFLCRKRLINEFYF